MRSCPVQARSSRALLCWSALSQWAGCKLRSVGERTAPDPARAIDEITRGEAGSTSVLSASSDPALGEWNSQALKPDRTMLAHRTDMPHPASKTRGSRSRWKRARLYRTTSFARLKTAQCEQHPRRLSLPPQNPDPLDGENGWLRLRDRDSRGHPNPLARTQHTIALGVASSPHMTRRERNSSRALRRGSRPRKFTIVGDGPDWLLRNQVRQPPATAGV